MKIRLPCCIEAPPAYVPKARYALDMLLTPLGIDPCWVDRTALSGQGICYGESSGQLPDSVLFIELSDKALAYFDGVLPYPPEQAAWRTWWQEPWPVLFGDDLIASAFFWLSGWQEHAVASRDCHARFRHEDSLQARLQLTARPAVDAYRERLAGMLAERGVTLCRRSWAGKDWAICPTFDVDYLRKWRKGMLFREMVEYPLLNYRNVSVGERVVRFFRFLRDWLQPGDVYRKSFERLHAECARHGTGTFLLKAGAHGPHDVAYRIDDAFLQRAIALLERDGFEIGLHGSYYSHAHPEYLAQERRAVESASSADVVSVRQHFLRYEVPATPRLQQQLGFRIDSTLGFSETHGFRRATSLPFKVFDIDANACTELWEMPLAVMDSALFNRRGLSVEEGIGATEQVLAACRRFRGVAVLLWHNILWDELDHPGWSEHFVRTLRLAARQGASVMSLRNALDSWMAPPSASSSSGEV